jgi:hypothetical protein
MTKYLISFPSEAMVLSEEEFPIVAAESHAVIEEVKAAGVYVFGGGIEEKVDPVLVPADGSVTTATYPGTEIKGGLTILELPDRETTEEWAGKIAAACRCSQELREFMYDQELEDVRHDHLGHAPRFGPDRRQVLPPYPRPRTVAGVPALPRGRFPDPIMERSPGRGRVTLP